MASQPLLSPKKKKNEEKHKSSVSAVPAINDAILHVGRHTSLSSLLEEIRGQSFLHVLRHGSEKRKQAEQLAFAVARLELKLQDMATSDMNYHTLASVVVELSLITDTPFDLVEMLHNEMQDALGSDFLQPTREETLAFMDEWADMFPELNELKTDFHNLTLKSFNHVALRVQMAHQGEDNLKDWLTSQTVADSEATKLVMSRIGSGSAFKTKWSKYPCMKWCIECATNSWRAGNYCFIGWMSNFGGSPYKDMRRTSAQRIVAASPMAWVMLADSMMTAHKKFFDPDTVENRHFYCAPVYTDLVQVVLPNFLASLIHLKSVLSNQAVQSTQTQAKIVAAAASGFVAFSQAAVAHLTRTQQHSCSCPPPV